MNKNFISVFLLMLAMGVSVMAQSYEEDFGPFFQGTSKDFRLG